MNLNPAINTGTKVIIYATPILGKAVTYIKPSWYRKVAVLDHLFVPGGSIKTEYLSIFKVLPGTGQRVAFKMKAVDITSGKDQYPMSDVATGTA